jgi:peptidoglycan hydrolase CwlO-like protein
MKKTIFSTLSILIGIMFLVSCSNEKLNKDDAPQDLKDAFKKSYDMSKELTDLQVEAGKDSKLDDSEIELICASFEELAKQNNYIDETFGENKYYNAVMQDHRETLKELSEKTKFLVDCEGYNKLGIAIQKTSNEIGE